ncbi:LytTR family transcriptional regulator [Octadecabacter sp. G9-8]|uniref:LytTR family transcriptional regulator n=1 Tax=Octadecabacter dasysiphoniae TaxID=2909341 RepID=A0ABS9CZV1_9RHOB|nr:LytTR family DNA-binding domain-containing protein [Octadecabacter dasysiphoniae]MCF2872317.1 LytTR family transcriptional regulator [Octadecabacter dasysiphoniae]
MLIPPVIRQTNRLAAQKITSSVFWIIIITTILLCFLGGPFGTLENLPSGFRLIYWSLSVTTTGVLGLWVHSLVRTQGWEGWLKISIVSGVFGLCVGGVIVLLGLTMLGPLENTPGAIETFGYSFPSAAVIFFVSIHAHTLMSETSLSPKNKVPALMKRLDTHTDAVQILALCAQDHYVEVITEKGSELCLLRLNDAISETAPLMGFQIHRSHWVAKSAVEAVEIKGSAPYVKLVNGKTLSISQSRLKKFEQFLQGHGQ